jgi:hypothetical protein
MNIELMFDEGAVDAKQVGLQEGNSKLNFYCCLTQNAENPSTARQSLIEVDDPEHLCKATYLAAPRGPI